MNSTLLAVMKERLTSYRGASIRILDLISHGIPMGMINLNCMVFLYMGVLTDSVEGCFG